MSFQFIKQLPTPDEIKEQIPMSEELKEQKRKRDKEIQDVFTGVSDKFLVIVGPCSCLLYTSLMFHGLHCKRLLVSHFLLVQR